MQGYQAVCPQPSCHPSKGQLVAYGVCPATLGGRPCPPLVKPYTCPARKCTTKMRRRERECVWSKWKHVGAKCDVHCGTGFKHYVRTLISHPTDKKPSWCGPTRMEKMCDAGPCNKDCKVSRWSEWTSCNHDCGPGVSTRHRHVLRPAEGSGKTCPRLEESKGCEIKPCSVQCKVGFAGAVLSAFTSQSIDFIPLCACLSILPSEIGPIATQCVAKVCSFISVLFFNLPRVRRNVRSYSLSELDLLFSRIARAGFSLPSPAFPSNAAICFAFFPLSSLFYCLAVSFFF